jgi:hypothetical protein
VIHQCVGNVGTLIQNNQLEEVAYQIGDCSPAIRVLVSHVVEQSDPVSLKPQLEALYTIGGSVITGCREPIEGRTKARKAYDAFLTAIEQAASHYDRKLTTAEVYICPMHPMERHLDASARCGVCAMALVRRRIAASSVYERPGEPSMKIVAVADHPLEVGRKTDVRIKIARNDGRPVVFDDLLVVHTQRIHLLIQDHSLGDYHHAHPTPTGTPGEYGFTFTPKRPGSYRIWADVVPGWSSIQEYLITDIGSQRAGGRIENRETTRRATVDGLTFELSFYPQDKSLRVGESVIGRISVTGADGAAFTQLEPIMGAFAHLVGFNEDGRTVVHIHPMGNEPTRPGDRGGPTLEFKYYPAAAGFTRLYCQVNIGGESKFAPFGVNVLPAEPSLGESGTSNALTKE